MVSSSAGWVPSLPTIDAFFAELESTTNQSLVLKFLATFARFEYALKRSGYTVSNATDCLPEWNDFVKKRNKAFQVIRLEGLDVAKRYFDGFPPKALVLYEGLPAWAEKLPSDPLGSMGYYSIMVRRVRNNLFHGEKTSVFLDRLGRDRGSRVIQEPSRNELLLQSSLVILEAFLLCDSDLRLRFLQYLPGDD